MNLFHRFQNQIIPSILITGMVLAGTASPDASAEGLLGDSSLLDRIESRAAEREEVLNGLHDMADQVAGQIEEHHADREERISSTRIRAAVKNGEDIRRIVPPAVANYVKEHRLYE